MDFSVCIPVYNVEPYLIRCLDSLFSQNFEGTFEVICVDDASTDNSLSILKDYQLKEPRLHIIELAGNKKISVARSVAFNSALGNYIMLVDSDDWLLQGTLSMLHRKCMETDADVIVYDYLVEDASGKHVTHKSFGKEGFVTGDKSCVQEIFSGAAICKIAKRNLVINSFFSRFEINWGEDFVYNTEILLKAKTIYLLPVASYVYCTNTASVTHVVMKNEDEMFEDRIVSVKATLALLNNFAASNKLILSLIDYHRYKFLILLFRIDCERAERIEKFKCLTDSMRELPLMTESSYKRLCFAVKYPLYALLYMALRFDFKLSLSVFYEKYLKHE